MRIIAHLDMDAFFAAVEERDTPRWRGLPLIVGADPQEGRGRGVVSTANYKAREYGIHSALPISKAWQFSQWAKQRGEPEAIFVEPDMEKYARVSEEIAKIAREFVPTIERASIDEMYLDLSFSGSYGKAAEFCQKIKKEITDKEKLTCSVGIGPNKLIAKIASDTQKPNGLTVVGADEEKTCTELAEVFLESLFIRQIPGIGPKTEIRLQELGIFLVRDLKKLSLEKLKEKFGKWGEDMYYKARGIDDSPVIEEYEAKSIGEQETFPQNTLDPNFIIGRLTAMCENVIGRMKRDGFKEFRTIALTVRFGGFETKTRAHTLKSPADSADALKKEALKLMMPFFDKRENPSNKLIRLIGVRVEKLE